MNELTKKRLLAAGLGILAVVVAVLLMRGSRGTSAAAPSSDGYYTGPMRNKRGDLVTEDGRILERAAPGAARTRPGAMPGAAPAR
ncbi:MAG TPA: hypothetical protein VM490_03095 [Armatimonadaceae bacterium]|nr:hypothetical protein [Armatimonadaceae bacterium]